MAEIPAPVGLADQHTQQLDVGIEVDDLMLEQIGDLDGTTDVEVRWRAGTMIHRAASIAIELSGPRPGGVSMRIHS